VVSVALKRTDHGYDALKKTVLEWGNPVVAVGILGAAATQTEKGGASLLEVGTWNEFGTETIPARSFIRATLDQEETAAKDLIVKLTQAVIKGKMTKAQALQLLGVWAQGRVQARIASSIPPPNAPSTIRQKGSSTTLINTGQLRSAISYEVRDK